MATNVINGTDLIIFMDVDDTPTPIAHGTNYTLSITMSPRPTTNKDSGQIEEIGRGRLDVTATCDCLAVYGSFEDIVNAHITGDAVHLSFGQLDTATLDSSESYAEGDFYISSIDINAPDGDNVTYTVSFEHAEGFDFKTV